MISKPIKIFFAGAACAALIAAAGFSNTYRLELKLHKLESECEKGTHDKSEQARLGTLANVTVSFADGASHIYEGVPDGVTPDQVEQRAIKDFGGKKVTHLDRVIVKTAPFEVCDAKSLVGTEEYKGIQAQIVQAQNDAGSAKEWPYFIALLVLLFSAIPWGWYFLLRRVQEIRNVIVGK
jgi:hypothetical protein